MPMDWVKLPTAWIRDGRLCEFPWKQHGSSATASLILFISLAILLGKSNKRKSADQHLCSVLCTYDQLQEFSKLSRAKIARGLSIISGAGIISVSKENRTNRYHLDDVLVGGNWGKLPQEYLEESGFLRSLNLRSRNELDSLKLYLILLAFRDRNKNSAVIGYNKITEKTGIKRNNISQAMSLLINYNLVRVSQEEPVDSGLGHPCNCYKILGIQ